MASMKRELDRVLKQYKGARTIPMPALIAMGLVCYGTSVKTFRKDRALAARMIRRCYNTKPGLAGGVVNPFYKEPKKRRPIPVRHSDGAINVEATQAAFWQEE